VLQVIKLVQELRTVRKNEPGCLRFDVIVFDDGEGRGAFVEVFADQESAKKPRELPHFREFFDAIEDIDVKWTTYRGRAIE
jgi:quinol monooxygenase YgiN